MNASQTNNVSPARRLLRESSIAGWWGWYLSAWFAAFAVACLILLVGTIAVLLENGGLYNSQVSLGKSLRLPVATGLLELEPIKQLMWLVGIGLGLALLQAFALWWFYRGIYARTREISRNLHEQVLATTLQVASSGGITAQRRRTALLIDEQLPRIRLGLIARWRAVPRSVVLTIICTCLALLVDVWLTLLAVISGLIVWRIYRSLERPSDGENGVVDLPLLRKRLIEAVQIAPLVSRIRGDDAPILESGGPLMRLMEANQIQDKQRALAVPIVTAATAVVVAVLVLALGGNMLVDRATITLPAALVLVLSLLGAVTGAMRVLRYLSRAGEFREACESIYGYVDRANNGVTSDRMGLGGKQHSIEMADVRLMDSTGRMLLDGISMRLEPASMVALLGTDPVAVNSLAELLLGFGNPKSGQLTIGDVKMSELHDRWLSQNVMWIGRSGPIWAGTITENLSSGQAGVDTAMISDAMRKSGVYDRVQALSEGFSSLITADDDRLDEAARYGLAVARAWIRQPAVVVVEEPPLATGTLSDDPCIETLRELAAAGSLVIVLPQKLRSLRLADRVILLSGGRLAGEGKHEELLATSDLYRHLNYVLFNPFRHMAPGGRHPAMA